MGVSFLETMRGDLRDEWGRSHLVEFTARAESSQLLGFLSSGRARLSGVIDAPPWAKNVSFAGALHISPFRGRSITYDIEFATEDTRYALIGRKDLGLSLRSFVELDTELVRRGTDGDHVVARGRLEFDFNDLGGFLRSWRPSSTLAQKNIGGLSTGELETMRALSEACLLVRAEVTVEEATKYLLRGPPEWLPAYRASLRLLDAAALLRGATSFSALSLDARKGVLETIDIRTLQLTTLPLKLAFYAHDEYRASIGYAPPEKPRPEVPPRWRSQIITPEDLAADQVLEADVVIVGSGAGGAPLAAELARMGHAVVVLEEGRLRPREELGGEPLDSVAKLWRVPAVNVGAVPVLVPTGRAIGGTTTINSGTCFSTPDDVLDDWRRRLGFPSDFAPDAFRPFTERVRDTLQVELAERRVVGPIGDFIGRGADTMGFGHGPLPRNAPGCSGAAVCAFGCPDAAKRSTEQSFMPAALTAGAVAVTGLPMTRILLRGRQAAGVVARGTDRHGSPRRLVVRAKIVVLACGTLETPLILQENGITLPSLGRNLSVHPAVGVFGRTTEEMSPWHSIPQGYGVEGHGLPGIRFEGATTPPHLFGAAMPLTGTALAEWMDDFPRIAQFGFMLTDVDRGRVFRSPGGVPTIRYPVSDDAQKRISEATGVLTELMLRAGASEVVSSATGSERFRDLQSARSLRERTRLPTGAVLVGFHPLGTCAMGADRGRSVVDFENRVHGTQNVFVVDGSVVPTPLGVNPQMTIMAFALRAAPMIARAIERQS